MLHSVFIVTRKSNRLSLSRRFKKHSICYSYKLKHNKPPPQDFETYKNIVIE
jgi:hypothetical protein